MASAPVFADRADGGANSAEFLRVGTGARAPAMGNAFTASADGVASLHYNPGGIGRTRRNEVEATYQDLVLDIGQGHLGAVFPWGDKSAWGVGVSYLNYGSTNRTTLTNTAGVITANNLGTFDGNDLAVGLSYGQWFGEASGGWGLGATGKIVYSKIDNADATAGALDLGLSYRSSRLPFEAGISVQNIGTKLKYDRDEEALPLLVRGGISYRFFKERLRIHADVEKVRHEEAHFMGGGEYWIGDFLALRAGYDGRVDEVDDGLTLGIGVQYEGLSADYAYIPYGSVGENHRVGLRYGWE